MAKKKIPKVKPQHPGDTFTMPELSPRISVEMRKAKNGYTVSGYKDGKDHLYVAKSHAEAKRHAHRLMKFGKVKQV